MVNDQRHLRIDLVEIVFLMLVLNFDEVRLEWPRSDRDYARQVLVNSIRGHCGLVNAGVCVCAYTRERERERMCVRVCVCVSE